MLRVDPAECAVQTILCVMREVFTQENTPNPPLGGGTSTVRFLAGDATPLSLWDAHASECECGTPLVWVRLLRRYRTNSEASRFGTASFPAPYVGDAVCGGLPVVAVFEVGIGRCAVVDDPRNGVDWNAHDREAEVSLDDSWRIELAMCAASGRLTADGGDGPCATKVGVDAVSPFGPDGGVLAWTGTMYVQF